MIPSLPDGVGVTIWNDESRDYQERADILLKNGILGLLLVLIALSLFLQIRLALWVAVGLAVSGIGALAVMFALDYAINTISLFSFVLAIAIVVAEYIHYERMRGTSGVLAAIRGTRRIKGPLIFARVQDRVDVLLNKFVQGPLDRGLRFATKEPGVTMAGAVALLVLCISLLLPSLASLQTPAGVPPEAATLSVPRFEIEASPMCRLACGRWRSG